MNATCVAATGVGKESWREDGAVDDHGGFSPPEDEGDRRCFLEEPGRVVDTLKQCEMGEVRWDGG